jgi:N-acetylmuramoyl-L-alanine amidase
VLDLARRARVHLANAGLQVRLTRDNDRFVELAERCRMAARWKADLFVSVHLNSAANGAARGVESYVLPAPGAPSTADDGRPPSRTVSYSGNRFDGANFLLGYHLHRGLLERTEAADRGIRHARYLVLRDAPCPAALMECGFLSSREEEALLETEAHRERVAQGLADGILGYIKAVKQARVAVP